MRSTRSSMISTTALTQRLLVSTSAPAQLFEARRIDTTGQVTDTLSYVVGKHQYRFGGEYRKAQVNEFYHRQALGGFLFDGSQGPWLTDFQNGTGFFRNINA